MKELLTVVSLLVSGVVGEAPYAPSGWRPDGQTLELPQRTPQKQQYLPPVDPRNNVPTQYGPPETDVSVQGLPTDEQLPIFQVSPVNGQQYVGSSLNADVRNLQQTQQQLLYQQQQQIYRQFARQRQLEAAANSNRFSTPQTPAQFAPRTTSTPAPTSKSTDSRNTPVETTTEALNLNEGEVLDENRNKDKVLVEVSKQNIQEFPPELYLSPLAQLNLQSQYAPLQLGQIQAPVYFQPAQGLSQKQVAGYDATAHFAAFPSVLANQQLLAQQQLAQQQLVQQQLAQQQLAQAQLQQQAVVQTVQPQVVQPQPTQNPSYYFPRAEQNPEFIPGQQVYQPVNQFQPSYDSAQTQPQYPQIQATPVIFQPQYNQVKGDQKSNEEQGQQHPQFLYQGYQPQGYQPQDYQPQGYQPQIYQPAPQEQPLVSSGYYPQMVTSQLGTQQAQQQGFQGQDGSLQSGVNANRQGNGIDQTEDTEDVDDNGSTVTAVATAFGSRTKPRVYNAYGVPEPKVQVNSGYQTTTEVNAQDEPEDPARAETAAPTRGDKRKSAKLRNRRIRPVFTLDKSGHLVLSQDQ